MKVKFAILTSLIISCTLKKKEDPKLTIQLSMSYKIDINKELYTTFFMSKPHHETKFTFTKDEKDSIWRKYSFLPLDFKSEEIKFDDSCGSLPKPFTIIEVRRNSRVQKIYYSNSCNGFKLKEQQRQAAQIGSFIKQVMSIVNRKQEVKNAPTSDIMYY
jgi:hypothetical protein